MNNRITAKTVQVISADGQNLGVMPIAQALQMAADLGLDLVEINAGNGTPITKIMDYGKYKFDAIKKEKELKKNQKVVELKEIQLSMTIDTHDMEVKAKHGVRFLKDGNKIKVVLRMKGRQQAYAKNAIEVVKTFYSMVSEFGSYDKEPEVVGRNVIMIISPKK